MTKAPTLLLAIPPREGERTCLVAVIILYHVLDYNVAVQLVRVVVLVTSTAVLIGPLKCKERVRICTTLEVFLVGDKIIAVI